MDGDFEVVEVDGLGYEVEGAPIHRGADVVHVAVCGDDDGADFGAHAFQLAQQRQAVHDGHVDVRQDESDVGIFMQLGQGFFAVVGEDEVDLALADEAAELLADEQFQVFLVVYHEEAGGQGRSQGQSPFKACLAAWQERSGKETTAALPRRSVSVDGVVFSGMGSFCVPSRSIGFCCPGVRCRF